MNLKSIDIAESKGFSKDDGEWYELTSAIDKAEIYFIHDIIKKYSPKRTLEIGCAEGVSSLTICELVENEHTIIDPFQTTYWQSHGINNLKKFGFNNFKLIEERSEIILPELYKNKEQFDFIFVDGWHTFDHVMVEFFYINHLLPVGGIVVFDDTSLPGLNKLMRYISNYPNYTCLGSAGQMEKSTQRQTLDKVKRIFNTLFSPLGKRLRTEIFNDTVVRNDDALKLNGSITAFKKTAPDERGWAWYEVF